MLTPWIGPHTGSYLPLGQVLLKARGESPDAGFWVLAAALVAVAYGIWFALLSGIAAWLAHRRRRRNGPGT